MASLRGVSSSLLDYGDLACGITHDHTCYVAKQDSTILKNVEYTFKNTEVTDRYIPCFYILEPDFHLPRLQV
jgi:hypothetical protein